MEKIYENIKEAAEMLAAQEYNAGPLARLILETSERVFATKKGCVLSEAGESDIEKLPFAKLPKGNQDIHAAVVAQTPFCMEWLRRGEPLIPSLDDMAQIIGVKAPLIDAQDGIQSAASNLARTMKSNAGCFVISGKNEDGTPTGYTITVGRTLKEAVVALTVLEKSAEVTLLTEKIGTPHHINAIERKLMRTVYLKKYSKPKANVGSNPMKDDGSLEYVLRQQLVDYGRKLVSCGLVQGTWGNLSVRLDEAHMLVTPSGIDYLTLSAGDMVKVNIHTLEYEGGLKPTSEKGLHAEVYRTRPEIGGVIHTHSKYCSVYAAAHMDLPVPAGDAACGFSNPVNLAKYALPGTKALIKNTAAAITDNYGAIMSNHGMIACGESLPHAFESCVKLEEFAKATLL